MFKSLIPSLILYIFVPLVQLYDVIIGEKAGHDGLNDRGDASPGVSRA